MRRNTWIPWRITHPPLAWMGLDSEQEEEEVLSDAEEVPEEDEDEWTPDFEWKRKRAALRETPCNFRIQTKDGGLQ